MLRGIAGQGGSDVWVTGEDGSVLHYDGTSWTGRHSRTSESLNGLWQGPKSTAYAVGRSGTVLYYDGAVWSMRDSGTTAHLNAVWGSGPEDVYAVGNEGIIRHYDGRAWSGMRSGTSDDLAAVWGSGPGDIWAAGQNGQLLHYDGKLWSSSAGDLQWGRGAPTLNQLWGSGPADVWAVGELWSSAGNTSTGGGTGTLLHYDGSKWTLVPVKARGSLDGITGTGPKDVWVVGGLRNVWDPKKYFYTEAVDPAPLLHFDGRSWSSLPSGVTQEGLERIWVGDGQLWAIGHRGGIYKRKP